MKKIGLLALAIVLALGTMGAGFAYWNETLTIEDTNLETGSFDQQFGGISKSAVPAGSLPITASGGGHTMTVTITKMCPAEYPSGPRAVLHFHIRGVGSIPAQIESVVLTPGTDADSQAVLPYVQTHGTVQCYDASENQYYGTSSWDCLLDDMDTAIENIMKTKMRPLDTNDRINFDDEEEDCISFWLDKNAPQSIEGKTLTFTLDFNFTQFNDPLTP